MVKRGRSLPEWIGVGVLVFVQSINWLAVLAALVVGIVLGGGFGELLAYLRHRGL